MDKRSKEKHTNTQNSCCSQDEYTSNECEKFINMSEQEEDIICRMHKLVGDKWELIAGRIPGRTAQEIERFWFIRNTDSFKGKRMQQKRK